VKRRLMPMSSGSSRALVDLLRRVFGTWRGLSPIQPVGGADVIVLHPAQLVAYGEARLLRELATRS
jgi:hypothetical protein